MRGDDPWRSINPPRIADTVNARRVGAELKWDFFWARSADRRVLLTLEHRAESAPRAPLPRLREVRVSLTEPDDAGKRILVFELLESSLQEIFHALCLDIISSTHSADGERNAVSIALNRAWRWHHLLRGGRAARLSEEEQRGLICELLVLEQILIPHICPHDAVVAWEGPLGSPQDFKVGRLAIEVKSRRSGTNLSVFATSEHQFDEIGKNYLFLCVKELAGVPAGTESGTTVGEIADRIRQLLMVADPRAAEIFESRITSAGVRPEDDYSQSRWAETAEHLFVVHGRFPRIVSGQLLPGVSRVSYEIALDDCSSYETSVDVIAERLLSEVSPDGD